jgi:hypothetical protein
MGFTVCAVSFATATATIWLTLPGKPGKIRADSKARKAQEQSSQPQMVHFKREDEWPHLPHGPGNMSNPPPAATRLRTLLAQRSPFNKHSLGRLKAKGK